jgi:hypothetical protein
MSKRRRHEKREIKIVEACGLVGAAVGLLQPVHHVSSHCRGPASKCAGPAVFESFQPYITHALWGAAIGSFLAIAAILSVRWRARASAGSVASRAIAERVRHEVWRRDRGRCVDCGSRARLEFDHIIPYSKGGSNTTRNIELRCQQCNRGKGSRI